MSIAQVYAEGRLIRNAWSRHVDGRELLCLYTAMVGDPEGRPETCPSHLCPRWLAHLLPWMDDKGTESAWPAMVKRVADLAPYFGRLRSRVEWQVRAACVEEAMRHTSNEKAIEICQRVVSLCSRRGRDEEVPNQEFTAAMEAASAWASVWVGREAAALAAWAAREAAASDRLTTAILDLIEADLREQGVLPA